MTLVGIQMILVSLWAVTSTLGVHIMPGISGMHGVRMYYYPAQMFGVLAAAMRFSELLGDYHNYPSVLDVTLLVAAVGLNVTSVGRLIFLETVATFRSRRAM